MQERKRIVFLAIVFFAYQSFSNIGAQTPSTGPGTGSLYSSNCATCHETHGNSTSHVPDRNALSQMAPEAIYVALTSGSTATHANVLKLKDEQKRDIAEFLSGRPMGSGHGSEASSMKNHCSSEPLGDPFKGAMWNGWGGDLTNARFQPADAAGLTAEKVPHLKFKWAFAFPNANSAWSQPVVLGGRVYV